MRTGPTTESGELLQVVLDDGDACVCGHAREAHEHFRRGSDCALCDCPRFRRR